MCEPQLLQGGLDTSGTGPQPKYSYIRTNSYNSATTSSIKDVGSPRLISSEINSFRASIGSRDSAGKNNNNTSRVQLADDVQRLENELEREMELHSVLENAVEKNQIETAPPASVPQHIRDLLSSITELEACVSRLEEEMVSLQFQLSQERNERRLDEYWAKHSSSLPQEPSSSSMSGGDSSMESTKLSNAEVLVGGGEPTADQRWLAPKGRWCDANVLSEEMVRCMKNIFISLSDSAPSVSSESRSSPVSPCDRLSSDGPSPQFRLHPGSEPVLAADGSRDPYLVRGKLSWSDIGRYAAATEVSWMSVTKQQLEYAAEALRRFRLLVEHLADVNPLTLSCIEKTAFWINVYNALIMHAYLAYGVPRSELKLFNLMQKAAYTVGRQSFSAAAIEYFILKMKPPVYRPQIALLLALQKLKGSEEQRKYGVDACEPLVCFGLSCGMYSSPAVRIYTAKNVREELEEARCDFIRASVGISRKGKVLVPRMLHCFAKNYADEGKLGNWISGYLPPQQADFVDQCFSRRRNLLLSRACTVLPFDSRFRYLFMPDSLALPSRASV